MRSTEPAEHQSLPRPRRFATAVALVLCVAVASPVMAAPSATGKNAAVITTWNQVTASVVTANPAAYLFYSFVHLAMYNAVNGITGRYELYRWDQYADMNASPEAAAAAAAHRVLSTYFPASAATFDAQLAASLAPIPSGPRRDRGVAYGRLAADHIISLRAGDGRGATVDWQSQTGGAAGKWVGGAFAVPWLGGVTPLALESLDQFDPGDPPQINSALYKTELDEVRAVGALNSTVRTEVQTATARYFSQVPFGPTQAALRGVATNRNMDISDSSRLFAATNTVIADALGTTWNAKLQYMWWRPIHAIHEIVSDGRDDTTPDTSWQPLIGTPPYPEWPSGLCSVVGGMTTALQRLTGGVNFTLATADFGSRQWTSKAAFDAAAVDARVWSGIHFRTADEIGIDIGTDAANWILDRYFAPRS
jgi:hypothetical protein